MTEFVPPPHYYDYLLGTDASTGEEIWVGHKDFALGGYLLGKRRMGKSTLLQLMIRQSIKKGHGVCLIDPHGDLLEEVIHLIPKQRMDDVVLLDPKDYNHPFGLNIYHCENKDNPLAVEYTTNLVMDIYRKLWKSEFVQPMVEDIILMTTLTIIANNMTMVEVPKLLFDDAFRRQLVRNVTNPDVLDFWKIYDNSRSIEREQGGGTVGRRLRQFTSSGILRYIVGQSEKPINIRTILDQRKILLIRLYSDLGPLTSLLGSTIVSQMLQAALSRSDTDQRPEFHLYCDEYSRFAVDSFAQIIQEAGKYQIIPFISHQSTGQISEENQDSAIQLGNLFCFGLIGKDAERLAVQYDLTPKQQELVIPGDPLYHLTDHPSKVVRLFEREYVRRLLEAKSLIIRMDEDEREQIGPDGMTSQIFKPYKVDVEVLPEQQFHEFSEIVQFRPNVLRFEVLPLLDRILYMYMTNDDYNPEDEMWDFMNITKDWYGFPNVYRRLKHGNLKIPDGTKAAWEAWIENTEPAYERDERIRFMNLWIMLAQSLYALQKDKIYVTPSTGATPQQTYWSVILQLKGKDA